MNQLFHKVSATKPTASRAESAEIYVIASGYKAPKRIDPQLLDPKIVFRSLEEDPVDKRPKIPNNASRKRNRDGYEDGVTTLYRRCSVLDFVLAEEPVGMLGEYNEFEFDMRDERTQKLLDMEETTEEVSQTSPKKITKQVDSKVDISCSQS